MPKLKINLDIATLMERQVHAFHDKDQVVLHETVSTNRPGLTDIKSVTDYLVHGEAGLGIHGLTDADGNIAWALGLGRAVLYHTDSTGARQGRANTRSIGIEQISRVMLDASTNAKRLKIWLGMQKEIDATARLLAAICHAHPQIPLKTSNGGQPGITTHWNVTRFYGVPGGHSDCWPVNYGGYYPLSAVIQRAKWHRARGIRF